MLTVERARDGDYGAQRRRRAPARTPFHASRNVEGFTHRDIIAPTFHLTRTGRRVDLSSVTGFLKWKTERSHRSRLHRRRRLPRAATSKRTSSSPRKCGSPPRRRRRSRFPNRVALKWQAGLFLFTQNYEQDAVNNYSPFVLSPFVAFPVSQHSPQSTLDDRGLGVYGAGHLHLRQQPRPHRRRARRSRAQGSRPEDLLLAADRAAADGHRVRRISRTSRRSSRSPTARPRRRPSTAPPRAASRRAASTRRRRRERKRTIRSTAGTTKAA